MAKGASASTRKAASRMSTTDLTKQTGTDHDPARSESEIACVSIKKPRGSIPAVCKAPDCNKLVNPAEWRHGSRRVAIVNVYVGGKWVRTEVYHQHCYERMRDAGNQG